MLSRDDHVHENLACRRGPVCFGAEGEDPQVVGKHLGKAPSPAGLKLQHRGDQQQSSLQFNKEILERRATEAEEHPLLVP